MSVDVTVRAATEADVDAIQSVARDAWHETYRDVLDEGTVEQLLGEGYAAEVVREFADREDVGLFVAEVDGEVVGYTSCTTAEAAGFGDLDLYVHPDYWGESVGERLFERSRTYLANRGVDEIRDEVLVGNEVGNAFYEKHFERVDTRTVEIAGDEHEANVYELDIE